MQGKIIILNTGGTIAMVTDETSAAVKPSKVQPLHAFHEQLNRYATVEMKDLYNLPSPHITPQLMKQLSQMIVRLCKEEQVGGIVITHGTDTLEETAYLLDLTITTNKPVVVTGAMRSNNELGADGPLNLIDSVRTAANKGSWNRGTLVVFNNEIHSAHLVTKTHTSSVATFQSPGAGPIGTISKKEIRYFQSPYRPTVYKFRGQNHQVPLIKMVAGFNPAWMDFLLDQPIDGLVLEAFGAGNVPPAILPTIKKLLDKKIPVVMVSRCFNGYVQDLYDYEGGGKQLKEMGVLFSNGLNGQKARIKLLVLLDSLQNPIDLFPHFSD